MIRSNDWVSFKDGLDKETCEKILNLAEDKLPKITDEGEQFNRHIENLRDQTKTDICWTDEQWIYDVAWDFMRQANEESGWKYEIHSAENVQIARYKKGMFYDWHPDGKGDHFSAYKSIGHPKLHGRVRKLSMSIMLNDDFEGGDFEFATHHHQSEHMEKTWKDRPAPGYQIHIPEYKQGTVIVFPSDMWHRVKPITKGIRYTLVVWFLGPPFK
mgnify:FL=1